MTTPIDEGISALFDNELNDHEKLDVNSGQNTSDKCLSQLCNDQQSKERWGRYQIVRDSLKHELPVAIDPDFSFRIMAAIESEPTVLAPTSSNLLNPDESPNTSPPTTTDSVKVNPISKMSGFVNSRLSENLGKRVAGFAIAASVTAISVLSFQYNYQTQTNGQFDVATKNAPVLSSSNVAAFDRQLRFKQSSALLSSTGSSTGTSTASSAGISSKASPTLARSINRLRTPIPPKTSRQMKILDPAVRAHLHKYIINHSQNVSGTRIQGVMPFARIVTGSAMSTLHNKKQQ